MSEDAVAPPPAPKDATTPPAHENTVTLPPQEPPLEIHKPHAAKTWKEFFIELGTIVLGIIIAICLEQSVEWLRWQGEVSDARQAITAEIAANNQSFMARRIAIAPCLDRQAQEAENILDDLQAKREPGRFTMFHPQNGSLLNFSEWESQRAAQNLTHFPHQELELLGSYYDQLTDIKTWMVDEGQAWRVLTVLQYPPAEIGISDLLRLRTALENAKEMERLIVLNARRQLDRSRKLGILTKPYDQVLVAKYCKG